MRPFQIECESLAGFHDGVRARVADRSATNSLVYQHESIHGRIFDETPDGRVLAAFMSALHSGSLPAAALDAVTQSTRTMIEAARLPHENFATYLSCKSMSPEAEANGVKTLTPEYLGYFRPLSDLIDGHFGALQLQFLFAWTCAIAVFSSSLVERLETLDISRCIQLTDDESPAKRFDLLIRAVRESQFRGLKKRLDERARAVCQVVNATLWDLDSYAGWMAALKPDGNPSPVPIIVEEALAHEMFDWLQDVLPFTFLRADRIRAVSPKFAPWVRSNLNPRWEGALRYFSRAEPTAAGSEAGLHRDNLRFVITRASESRIFNERARQLPRWDSLPKQADSPLWLASSIAISSAAPPHRNLTHWSVFAWSPEEKPDAMVRPKFGVEVGRSEVVEFLSIWAARVSRGEPVPHLRAVVLGISGLQQLKQIIIETDSLFYRHQAIADKLCWYCWGDLLQAYDLASTLGRPLYSEVLPFKFKQCEWQHLVDDAYRFEGLVMRQLHIGEQKGLGLFVRLLPLPAAAFCTPYEMHVGGDEIRPMTDELMRHYAPISTLACSMASSLWDEY